MKSWTESSTPPTWQLSYHRLIAAPAKQAPLEHVRVRGVPVDISLPAIRQFLYGENVDSNQIRLTAEFDYR